MTIVNGSRSEVEEENLEDPAPGSEPWEGRRRFRS